jgi:transcriptional regulator NrdR family protein
LAAERITDSTYFQDYRRWIAREPINIKKLNNGIEETVSREIVLRNEIDEIIKELEDDVE